MDAPGVAQSVFITILEMPHVRTSLFSALSPRSLLLLSRSSRRVREYALEYMKTAFDINATLGRYLPNPIEFRGLQARTGTLVSGSTALQFFDRSYNDPLALDLYVFPLYRREVGAWLLSKGFSFRASHEQDPCFAITALSRQRSVRFDSSPGVLTIYTFHRYHNGASVDVHIIVAIRTPIETILSFHSTCMMNIISYDKAYCLFPLATLEKHISLLCSSSAHPVKSWVGARPPDMPPTFTLLPKPDWGPSSSSRSHQLYPHTPRWLGDSYSWTLPLGLLGVSPPPPPQHVLPSTQSRSCRCIKLFNEEEVSVLNLAFVVGDEDTANHLARTLQCKQWQEEYEVTICDLEDWS
ncbi:hypothetical protein ONZ51_g13552 [Trametes cubensis]|uniref:F-box domain-containing protein n=1 Tax=Trametes cubensis TaxID=1111947 RepID=A0AAD7TEJ5_9APHY|nr:hypothetical protein ONZ51_g13552 [Trametes cubensis]